MGLRKSKLALLIALAVQQLAVHAQTDNVVPQVVLRDQYAVHVLHVDRTTGEFAGQKYDSLRNHFTYTFIKADGADPCPALPLQHGAD